VGHAEGRPKSSVDAAKAIVKKPLAAYVERVYQEADFAVIGTI
jgi:hypothetical protein